MAFVCGEIGEVGKGSIAVMQRNYLSGTNSGPASAVRRLIC